MGTESVVSAGTIPARLWGAARVGTERAPTVCGVGAQFLRCFASAQPVDTRRSGAGRQAPCINLVALTVEKTRARAVKITEWAKHTW
jgi:hypothetical protein